MKKYQLKSSPSLKPSIDLSSHLNPEQLAAVTSGDGVSLVIAGAGSGKTRVVTYRVAYLIDNGIPPSRIMLLTFTNKAAREMLHRVELLIKGETRRVAGGTFHHIGNMILRKYGAAMDINPNFTILDREDSKNLIESCVAELSLRKDKMFPKGAILMDIIGYAVGAERSIGDVIEERFPHVLVYADDIADLKNLYEKKKRLMNHMDFDDLLSFWKELLITVPEVKERLSEKYLYVLVDEYQDTNKIQAEIVDLMASKSKNLMVVGDDSQSIYSFRGACFDNIIEFPERYPGAQIFTLATNYRSTEEILRLANKSIAHNTRQFPKELHSLKRTGPLPALVPLQNNAQQAEFISQRILDLIDEGVPLAEIAVLYRSHYQSMDLQMELTRRRIPYEVRSGLRFFEQAHIKDIISYLRAVLNPRDEISWIRILKLTPGIGSITAKKIFGHIADSEHPLELVTSDALTKYIPKRGKDSWHLFRDSMKSHPSEAIREILGAGYDNHLKSTYENYEERKEDIEQLSIYANNFKSTNDFLSDLALLTSVQAEDVVEPGEEGESIVLSTIHRAKGLEWSRVFVIGLTDGGLPPARAMDDFDKE
ncbi:MAG: hypothetical protein AMK71_08490, partial [Nitrospira bacterium SG8_35_4]